MRSPLPAALGIGLGSILLMGGCAGRKVPVDTRSAVEIQAERAAEPGPDQPLEQARLASMVWAEGDSGRAEKLLRTVVGRVQDQRGEGQFRATVGAESAKEWKGEPYERMMAAFLLGTLLLEDGDTGNALAMSKAALLSDTGTSARPYRSDFVPAYVLQALAFQELGEKNNAERSIEQAIDAVYLRTATGMLSDRLVDVEGPGGRGEDAARGLLLSGLPPGLMAHPRDLHAAIDGALSYATDARAFALDAPKKKRPPDLRQLSNKELRQSLEAFEPLVKGWHDSIEDDAKRLEEQLAGDEGFLRSLVDRPPTLLMWVERGQGPMKVADGRYGEIQRIVATGGEPSAPIVRIDGEVVGSHYLDSVLWQAQTRGSRGVDGFLRGKAIFKDAAPFLGYAALIAGNVARAHQDPQDSGAVGTALYVLGAATWVAGALTNPRADTRSWRELPDQLYLVAANPPPGAHRVTLDGRTYTVEIPDDGTVVHLVPHLDPGGGPVFGTPCVTCAAPTQEEASGPLAIPADTPAPGGTP